MTKLPYVTTPGNIEKALNGIKVAAVPPSISQDFVKTVLGVQGGSGNQMTAFLKKIGLARPDGTPTELYHKFRNPSSSGSAIAECIRIAYRPLYLRNEYMHQLSSSELTGLVIEETGQPHDSAMVKGAVSCIDRLKNFASFDQGDEIENSQIIDVKTEDKGGYRFQDVPDHKSPIGLNLGYTINLNLPATSDPAVFDAIFKSLKENLLREDDA